MCPKMKQLFGGALVLQEQFALFEYSQRCVALFGYFVVVGGFVLFGVGVYLWETRCRSALQQVYWEGVEPMSRWAMDTLWRLNKIGLPQRR